MEQIHGKYDALFYRVLPFYLDNPNIVIIYTQKGGAPFGFKGKLTAIEPYDYVAIDNEIFHFIDNDIAILMLGYYDKDSKSKTKVQTLYKPDLTRKLKNKFTDQNIFLGYTNETEDISVVFDQEKVLGYSVKSKKMQDRYNNIGKPIQYFKK